MDIAIKETKRRREIQEEYNKIHNVEPKTIEKKINDVISNKMDKLEDKKMSKKEKVLLMQNVEEEMKKAARELDFERAMELRNILFEMKGSK